MRPQILVTNDDGVGAPGLVALAAALAEVGDVVVVAPEVEQSGTSRSLSLHRALEIVERGPGWFSVSGTPADCVNLAFLHLLTFSPQIVVSGVNNGFNLGDDIYYSGTVAAALEGRVHGALALAISAAWQAPAAVHELAAGVAARLVAGLLQHGMPVDAILNVNVPDDPRGFRVTRQGRRAVREGLLKAIPDQPNHYRWIGLPPTRWIPDPLADHAAIDGQLISVSPLHSDFTFHRALPELERWIPSCIGLHA